MADQQLSQIVQRMVEAGESEADIASVIQLHKQRTKPAEQPHLEGKSVGGFLTNALTSTGKLLKDTAVGAVDMAKFAAVESGLAGRDLQAAQRLRAGQTAQQAPRIAGAVGQAAKDRYGSLENIGNTLYTDPAGVASDLSTLLTLGGSAAATKAPKVAGMLRKAGEVTNPLRVVTEPAGRLANTAANLTVRGTLRPSKAIREDFGGSKGVADAVLKERVYSDASAQRKLSASTKEADDLLAAKEADGVRGVPAQDVADSLRGSPSDTASRRRDLGIENTDERLAARRQNILDQFTEPERPGSPLTTVDVDAAPDSVDAALRATNELGTGRARMIPTAVFGGNDPAAVRAVQQLGPQANLVPRRLLGNSQHPPVRLEFGGSTPPTPASVRDIPLTRAQVLKREAQDLAYEAAKNNLSLDQQAHNAVARSLRQGIESRVPEVKPINERSQRLLGAQRAFAEAEDRPERLTDLFSLTAAGGGAAVGDPLIGLLTAALIKGSRSPRAGAMLGIGMNEAGNMIRAPAVNQAALLARLAGQLPE